MAELGAIASIIALIGAGAKLSITLFDLASAVGSAGTELQSIANEVTLFCAALKQIKSVLHEPDTYHFTQDAIELTRQIVERCRSIITEIDKIVKPLEQTDGIGIIPSIEWVNKVKWTFKRSKVSVQRQTLESCKKTLHLVLTTMEWSKNFSSRRAITVDTILEDEQDQMITQGLVISQQYSINELSKLEDEEMTEVDSPPSTSTSNRNIVITHIGGEDKRSGRISQMLDKLSNRARTPSPQPLSKKRTSVWLNELVFGDDTVSDPHPGVRQKRLSSVTTAQEPLQLLKRWTDHGEHYQRHYSIFDGSSTEKKDLFAESSFLFTDDLNNALTVKENAVDDHSISNLIDPIDKVKRVYTIPISPKTSISVNPKPKPQISRASIGISLPTIIENQDPSEIVYDEYLTSVLQNIGLHRESNSLFELFVTYGGQSRVLKSNDKPHLVFDQLQEFGLQPQFVLRRLPEFILEEVDDTLQLTEEPVSVE